VLRSLRAHPWRFAGVVAGGVALAAFVTGWVNKGDPQSGMIQALFEGVAVLASFALLSRPLALRR
jgi:hypothetical protein